MLGVDVDTSAKLQHVCTSYSYIVLKDMALESLLTW